MSDDDLDLDDVMSDEELVEDDMVAKKQLDAGGRQRVEQKLEQLRMQRITQDYDYV